MTETKHWHKLPRECVESPPLEILKSSLGRVLGDGQPRLGDPA